MQKIAVSVATPIVRVAVPKSPPSFGHLHCGGQREPQRIGGRRTGEVTRGLDLMMENGVGRDNKENQPPRFPASRSVVLTYSGRLVLEIAV